jgi:hypothetical protein
VEFLQFPSDISLLVLMLFPDVQRFYSNRVHMGMHCPIGGLRHWRSGVLSRFNAILPVNTFTRYKCFYGKGSGRKCTINARPREPHECTSIKVDQRQHSQTTVGIAAPDVAFISLAIASNSRNDSGMLGMMLEHFVCILCDQQRNHRHAHCV